MRRTCFTCSMICMLLIGAAGSGEADTWTLDRTVETAVRVSNSAAVEMLNAGEADIDAVNAEKSRLPVVSISAGANIVSDVMEIDMPLKKIRFGDYDSYDMKLGINQLLYDGGRLKALKEAGESRSVMNNHHADAAGLLAEYQAKTAFYRVIMAEESAESARTAIREAEIHLRDVKARYDQGMALENDVLRARLRISTANMELVTRTADIERAKAFFRKVVGIDPGDDVEVSFDSEEKSASISIPLTNTDTAQNRPEFKAFDAAVSASEKTARSARAGAYPNVVMFGAFNYGRPGLDMPANDWMHYFSGGIHLNWNVWDWGKTNREIEKAELNKRKILKNRSEFERSLSEQITEAAAAFDEAQKRAGLAREAAEFSKKNLELTASAYREGMASETDYDNAHAAYSKAVQDQSVSKVMVQMSAAYSDYVWGIRYKGKNDE